MRIKTLLALSIMALPGVAAAQKGGGRPSDPLKGMETANESDRSRGVKLSTGDVEKMNPLKLLLDKKKDLQLTDAQVAQIQSWRDSLAAKNAPLIGSIDSLVYATRTAGASAIQSGRSRSSASSSGDGLTESESDDVRAAKRALSDMVKNIRGNYAAAAQTAVAALTPDQQQKAKDMLEKQGKDADKTMRSSLGGR